MKKNALFVLCLCFTSASILFADFEDLKIPDHAHVELVKNTACLEYRLEGESLPSVTCNWVALELEDHRDNSHYIVEIETPILDRISLYNLGIQGRGFDVCIYVLDSKRKVFVNRPSDSSDVELTQGGPGKCIKGCTTKSVANRFPVKGESIAFLRLGKIPEGQSGKVTLGVVSTREIHRQVPGADGDLADCEKSEILEKLMEDSVSNKSSLIEAAKSIKNSHDNFPKPPLAGGQN